MQGRKQMKRSNQNADTRLSLADFKAKSEVVSVQASVHQITGGALADCHTGKTLQ